LFYLLFIEGKGFMAELNALFLAVGQFCRREVVCCAPEDNLMVAAAQMRQLKVSSLVVCTQQQPVGILTDQDLRNKVAAAGLCSKHLCVAEVMSSPVIQVNAATALYEALYRLSRYKIRRLVVTDDQGGLFGILSDSDILRIHTRSPQQLVLEIAEAEQVEQLKELHQRVGQLVHYLVGTGVATVELVRLVAHLNDRILMRLTELLLAQDFADMTEDFSFMVLGSEGRKEQTLTTDQDNALIYADGLAPEQLRTLESFSHALIEGLIAIGVPPCPGGIMAKNPTWRRSLSQWQAVLENWFASPTPENIMKVSMFADLRRLYGSSVLTQRLQTSVAGCLRGNDLYLSQMVANLLRFDVPLGWFGGLKSTKGEKSGWLDIKKAGIFAITEGVKILSLAQSIEATATSERIEQLVKLEILEPATAADLQASFFALVQFRLRTQMAALDAGQRPHNLLRLSDLTRMDQERLRAALTGVSNFQQFLARRYPLARSM